VSRRGSRRIPWLLATVLLAASGSGEPAALAGETPIPAAPAHFATDGAGFLSEAVRVELDERLRAFETSTGHQVLLWIGRTTGDAPIEDWAVRAFAAWRVGRKGLDDGVVLFIMADDRKLRIEVGYGLEDRLPDARAASIIREQIAPRLRNGDRDGAARAGIGAILGALGAAGGVAAPVGQPELPQLGLGGLAILVLLGILMIGFFVTHPTLAILFLTHLASSRGMSRGGRYGGFGGSGGGFSGGGFSGGGGRSGGGGATGSW
jgi:uncharacterized protein